MSPVSLYQPGYLWGLVALTIPVIIHFLNRHRSRSLDFSTLRFFRATALRAAQTRRLKRFLLLCVRLLLLATLVAVFSQPFDKHDPFAALSNPNAALYCWVDPTKSMDYINENTFLWKTAMACLDSLDKKATPSVRRYWYDELQGAFTEKKSFHYGRNAFTRHGPPLCETMCAAFKRDALHSSRQPLLLIFSDFQEPMGRQLDSFMLSNKDRLPVICVSVAPRTPWNFGIENVRSPKERPSVVVNVVSAVGKDCNQCGISALSGDLRVGHEDVTVKSGQRLSIAMNVMNGNRSGGGKVQLETEDPFPLDNTRYFTWGEARSRRVLVIGDSIGSFPIVAALRSIEPSPWNPVVRCFPNELRMNDLDSADLIVCNEITSVPPSLLLLLATRSLGAKAIMVSPAIDSQSVHATKSLVSSASGIKEIRLAAGEKPCRPVFSDTVSMLWKGFPRTSDRDVVIHRYLEPLPGAVLCGMDNRKQFATLMLDSIGNSWVFFAAPVGRHSSNNLCETGLYVPLLDRIAAFALESICRGADEWVAGRPRRNPFLGTKRPSFIYDARDELRAQWSNQPSVKIDEPGIYRIQPDGAPSYWIAVNSDSQETALRYRRPQTPAGLKRNVLVTDSDGFLRGLRAGKGLFYSYGLWLLMAVLLLVEMLLWEKFDVPAGKTTTREDTTL